MKNNTENTSLFEKCSDLQALSNVRLKNPKNPEIGYLNINSLRNKIIDVREVFINLQLDYFVLSETIVDESFPTWQFHINGYEIRNRRDRDKHGGGLIEFVRSGFITKPLRDLETKISETICSEFTISKKKWFCLSVYRPPSSNNLNTFFEELTTCISKAINKYDNIIVMGDFNIDIMTSNSLGFAKFEEFCDTFNLFNLIKSETCFTSNHKSHIDLFSTNKPLSFKNTNVSETGLSDCHKLISTFLKSNVSRLKPHKIYYRSYKNFDEEKFMEDVAATNFSFKTNDANENYFLLTDKFSKIVDKHAPLKRKVLRGNHAPFINKELRKAIYTRTRLKNKFNKIPSEENKILYKKQRNICVSLRKKAIKRYFSEIASKGIMTNKDFWKVIKPFLTNKGCLTNSDIMLIDNDQMITDDKKIVTSGRN